MIARTELLKIAWARLKDAEVLFGARRYDGAIYICGYAVEIRLKARICRTLRWQQFPETVKEFREFQSLKTHNLDVLLRLSGIERKIKPRYLVEWSIVGQWEPGVRYRPIGSAKRQDAQEMITAADNIMKALL